ncbi:MAG: hypothetical protein KDB46_11465, partial [Solirubrobacterales bacterium]|nr:hypothetical protein [Solirubrobacterales bacterium]
MSFFGPSGFVGSDSVVVVGAGCVVVVGAVVVVELVVGTAVEVVGDGTVVEVVGADVAGAVTVLIVPSSPPQPANA